jgi:cyclopropane-fatty-acyl-phospholipid synthase
MGETARILIMSRGNTSEVPCATQQSGRPSPCFLQGQSIMIYTFKSQASANVIMLEPNGDQMLTIVGKEPSAQGIITVAQIPSAIAALQAAIAQHEAVEAKRREQPGIVVEVEGDSVLLRDRAAPFIDLLQTSVQAGKDVYWGV